ncbi:MAG: hypothetical protein FWE44_08025 [Defluviitaleaceae bacterium]|nr:hypothetical protein [Defluviitaleaceae bacterium]
MKNKFWWLFSVITGLALGAIAVITGFMPSLTREVLVDYSHEHYPYAIIFSSQIHVSVIPAIMTVFGNLLMSTPMAGLVFGWLFRENLKKSFFACLLAMSTAFIAFYGTIIMLTYVFNISSVHQALPLDFRFLIDTWTPRHLLYLGWSNVPELSNLIGNAIGYTIISSIVAAVISAYSNITNQFKSWWKVVVIFIIAYAAMLAYIYNARFWLIDHTMLYSTHYNPSISLPFIRSTAEFELTIIFTIIIFVLGLVSALKQLKHKTSSAKS